MSELKNLRTFCDEYFKKTNLKIHPSAVPVDVVLDELLGSLKSLRGYHDNLVSVYNNLNERVTALEEMQTRIELPRKIKITNKKAKNE